MILSLLLTAIYFFILFFFGWQLARYFLKEDKIEHLMGLAGILGIGLYVFFINALGYFIPIKIVFYLVLALFFAVGLVLLHFNKKIPSEWGINVKWRKILLGTALLLVVISSLVYFRSVRPNLTNVGWPTVATIVEGNFPVVEIWNPRNSLNYHYAVELFSASTHKITGLPISLSYNFQVAILVGVLFLLGFGLVKKFFGENNFKALTASLLMIYAGTISFLNIFRGIPILYNLYIRHQDISAPFKFVSDAIDTQFSIPVLKNIISVNWGPLDFPLIIVVIYLYFHLIDQRTNFASRLVRYGTFLICGLLLALLALIAETYFTVLCLILFIYPFIFGFVKKDWPRTKNFLLVSFFILIIALPLAFLQGGILKGILTVALSRIGDFTDIAGGFFKTNEIPWIHDYYPDQESPIFYPNFWIEWLPLLAVLIPAFIFLLKKNFQFGSFFGLFVFTFFLIASFISGDTWAYIGETFGFFLRIGLINRFFFPMNLIGGLVIGLFLAHLYLSFKKVWLKRLVILIITIFMSQSLFFQLRYLAFAYPAWDPAEKAYAKPGSFEEEAYDWVRKNTTINDLFFVLEGYCNGTDSPGSNYKFILNAGRMAPIYVYSCAYPENELFKKIKENCDSLAIKDLKYAYLYVNEAWPEGLEEKCLANNDLELKFEAGEGDEFARIYKILNQKDIK